MKKLIYSILFFIGIFLFIPNVFAYNSNFFPDLIISDSIQTYFYGWSSSTIHGTASYMSLYTGEYVGTDNLTYDIAHRNYTNANGLYTDTNGYSILNYGTYQFNSNSNYNVSFALCSLGGSLGIDNIAIGTSNGVNAVETTNYGTINNWNSLSFNSQGIYNEYAISPVNCELVVANFTPSTSGSFISLRTYSNSTIYLGNYISYLGYTIDSNGLDYTTYFNNINTSITNSQNAIINNQNSNRDAIINNQNENTNKQIESQEVCNIIDKEYIKNNGFLLSNQGDFLNQTDQNFGTTDYIRINQNAKIKKILTSSINLRFCFYDSNKTYISCNNSGNVELNTNINIPDNSYYIRITLNSGSNRPQYQICLNGNQVLNDNITGLNDNITNSDTDNPDNIFSGLQSQLATNGVITQLLTLPITFYTKILNSLNATCTDYSVGYLLGTEIVFPCINIADYIGSTLWGVIDILFSGLFIFTLSKKFIKVFNHMSSMKEGDVISD